MKKTNEAAILRSIKSIDETPQSVHQGINMSVANFLESISRRRSIYNIGKNVTLSQEEIVKVIEDVVEQSPSAFHAQSSRVVVLFGEEHQKLWNIVKDTLRPMIPAEQFAQTEGKIDGCFAAGVGTVLFFEDQEVIKGQQAQFPLYADKFPEFSEQHAGMAQFMVWTALAEVGLGATLQHYNPLIDNAVAAAWNLPASWTLRAQMPFGSIEQAAEPKTFIARAERFKVFG